MLTTAPKPEAGKFHASLTRHSLPASFRLMLTRPHGRTKEAASRLAGNTLHPIASHFTAWEMVPEVFVRVIVALSTKPRVVNFGVKTVNDHLGVRTFHLRISLKNSDQPLSFIG